MLRSLFLFCVSFLSLVGCIRIYAVIAVDTPITLSQEDGTKLEVRLKGDEWFHYAVTKDGVVVISDEDGYKYAEIKNGNLLPSDFIAHEKEERSRYEIDFIARNNKVVSDYLVSERRRIQNSINRINEINGGNSKNHKIIGRYKGLVILVNFQDITMSSEDANAEFNDRFNKRGFRKDNHIGSVRDFFYDQSYGKFELEFDVIGPVTVSREMKYYGANTIEKNDINAGYMVSEALTIADKYVDFSTYDWDKDGEVENVFFVYAGYGEASGAPSNTIWPHKSSLTGRQAWGYGDGPLYLDGVKIDTYACSCELSGYSGKRLMGIGTACHEFSHCLGLPDLYDVDYSGGFGMSYWDLMGSGGYSGPNGIGEVPSGLSAYNRYMLGWLELEELKDKCSIDGMGSINNSPVAYAIYNDNNKNELFVLENRQNSGWFSFTNTSDNCHGLLITHIDYNDNVWSRNKVNDDRKHQRYTVVAADNDYGPFNVVTNHYLTTNSDLEGDLFPGNHNVTSFNGKSHINVGGKLFNVNQYGEYDLNKVVKNIREIDGKISFDFDDIRIEAPTKISVNVTNENSILVEWIAPEIPVDSYNLELIEIKDIPQNHLLLSDNFALIKNSDSSDVDDISKRMNLYTQQPGWSGKNVFASKEGAKVGSYEEDGYILTPPIESKSGKMTLKLNHRGADLKIEILNSEWSLLDTFTLISSDDFVSSVINFGNFDNGEKFYIKFIPIGESTFDSIYVYDGTYSEADLDPHKILEDISRPFEIRKFEGIISTELEITDLLHKHYKFRIQSQFEDYLSDWTEYYEVDLNDFDSIDDILSDGFLDGDIVYYNIQGYVVSKDLTPGLYIEFNRKNNSFRKILIR